MTDLYEARKLLAINEAESQPCPNCGGPMRWGNEAPEFRDFGFNCTPVLMNWTRCAAQCYKADPEGYVAKLTRPVMIPPDPGMTEKKNGRPPAPPIPSINRREFSLISLASLGILAAISALIAAVLALT